MAMLIWTFSFMLSYHRSRQIIYNIVQWSEMAFISVEHIKQLIILTWDFIILGMPKNLPDLLQNLAFKSLSTWWMLNPRDYIYQTSKISPREGG